MVETFTIKAHQVQIKFLHTHLLSRHCQETELHRFWCVLDEG